MSIPMVTMPKQGPILTRPRRESIYDTEGYDDGNAPAGKVTIYKNSASFANTSLGLSKIKGRDHNLDGQGGMLSVGQMFHWYGVSLKYRTLNCSLSGNLWVAAALAIFDTIRRLKEYSWWTFYFSQSHRYLSVPAIQIPSGCASPRAYTTHNATTFVGAGQDVERANIFDITLNGMPTEINALESFSVDIDTDITGGTNPTPGLDLYVTNVLKGVLFKGIQG